MICYIIFLILDCSLCSAVVLIEKLILFSTGEGSILHHGSSLFLWLVLLQKRQNILNHTETRSVTQLFQDCLFYCDANHPDYDDNRSQIGNTTQILVCEGVILLSLSDTVEYYCHLLQIAIFPRSPYFRGWHRVRDLEKYFILYMF